MERVNLAHYVSEPGFDATFIAEYPKFRSQSVEQYDITYYSAGILIW